MPTTTPAPACLPIQDAPQRLTARARTEPLLRHSRSHGKENVAARPLARLPDKIFRNGGWALARARLYRLQLRSFTRARRPCHLSGHLLLDTAQRCFPARRPLLSLPFPIAARLLPTTLLTGLTGPVGPRAPPPPPACGLLPAAGTAIPFLRLPGLERLFTPLEQTAPLPKPGSGVLRRNARRSILRQAHGSRELPGVSLAAELLLRREAFLLAHPDGSPAYRREREAASAPPRQPPHPVATRAAIGRVCPVAARAGPRRYSPP